MVFRKFIIIIAILNLIGTIGLFFVPDSLYTVLDAGFGIELSFRLFGLPRLILIIVAVLFFLVSMYTVSTVKGKTYSGRIFILLLISVVLANGVVLANNPVAMLFFLEAMSCTYFGILIIASPEQPETAVKTFITTGIANLFLMFGVIMTVFLSEAHSMTDMVPVPIHGLGILGFVCLLLGAMGRIVAVPFPSRNPDAAEDVPLSVLLFLPSMLDKLLGIYLLIRITGEVYSLKPGSLLVVIILILAAGIFLFSSRRSLIEKELKKFIEWFSMLCFKIERRINYFCDVLVKKAVLYAASAIHIITNGLLSRYITLALIGFIFLMIFVIAAL